MESVHLEAISARTLNQVSFHGGENLANNRRGDLLSAFGYFAGIRPNA